MVTATATTLNALQLEAGMGYNGMFFSESFEDGITAKAGGGQSGAYQLTRQNNRLTVVATAGDSVKLPPALPGLECFIINHGAQPAQIFGNGTDTINDVAAATGVPQMPNSTVIYLCMTAGIWYTEGLASGFVPGGGSFQTYSTQTGITAHAGGTQAAAVPITAMNAQVSVCATAGDSVVLPPAKVGMEVTVVNNGAASCNVFAASQAQGGVTGGDTMNQTQNGSVAVATNTITLFFCFVVGVWITK